tara:strand:+ start:49 stop:432 length:384 start_codon:yes stop_codon:yes gene_type:complete
MPDGDCASKNPSISDRGLSVLSLVTSLGGEATAVGTVATGATVVEGSTVVEGEGEGKSVFTEPSAVVDATESEEASGTEIATSGLTVSALALQAARTNSRAVSTPHFLIVSVCHSLATNHLTHDNLP